MTLNGVIALILGYFTEFGIFRGALLKSGWRCCRKKFTFAVSSPDEFFVHRGYGSPYVVMGRPLCFTPIIYLFIMAALWNRAGHYIFALWFLSFYLSFFLA